MVSDSSSEHRRGGGSGRQSRRFTYTEVFERLCPEYMAIGMTYDQFWDGDSTMAPAFRNAYVLKRESDDWRAWRQGAYFYEALCDVAPIFRALSKAKRPLQYAKEPYGFGEHASETVKEEKENREMKAAKKSMEAFMVAFNKRFEKPATSEVSADGGRADPRN